MSSTHHFSLEIDILFCVLSLQLAYDLVYGSDVKVEVKRGRVELELWIFCELIATGYSDETWRGIDPSWSWRHSSVDKSTASRCNHTLQKLTHWTRTRYQPICGGVGVSGGWKIVWYRRAYYYNNTTTANDIDKEWQRIHDSFQTQQSTHTHNYLLNLFNFNYSILSFRGIELASGVWRLRL